MATPVEMTPAQLAALESYICSTVRIMVRMGDHPSNVRLMLDSKQRLETAFGQTFDLFTDTPTVPILPDLL